MTAHTAHIAIRTGNTASLPAAGLTATVAANRYGAMKGPRFIMEVMMPETNGTRLFGAIFPVAFCAAVKNIEPPNPRMNTPIA